MSGVYVQVNMVCSSQDVVGTGTTPDRFDQDMFLKYVRIVWVVLIKHSTITPVLLLARVLTQTPVALMISNTGNDIDDRTQ